MINLKKIFEYSPVKIDTTMDLDLNETNHKISHIIRNYYRVKKNK